MQSQEWLMSKLPVSHVYVNRKAYANFNNLDITFRFYVILMCMLSFLTFTREFSFLEYSVYSSVHSNSQKSVYSCLVITLCKCEYCFILFGCNSVKVSVLCDMNSEKSFYYSLIWKELSANISIV